MRGLKIRILRACDEAHRQLEGKGGPSAKTVMERLLRDPSIDGIHNGVTFKYRIFASWQISDLMLGTGLQFSGEVMVGWFE